MIQQNLVPLSDTKSLRRIARCHARRNLLSDGKEINSFSGALLLVFLHSGTIQYLLALILSQRNTALYKQQRSGPAETVVLSALPYARRPKMLSVT